MERKTLFADILLPLPLPGYFTYRVPYELNDQVKMGVRVIIPFGKKKVYSGLVRRVHETIPQGFSIKYITSVLDPIPIVTEAQFLFWEWIADYYMAYPGDVMNVALPPAMKLAGETKITINPDYDGSFDDLNEREFLIAEALQLRNTLTLSEVGSIAGIQKVFNLISNLMDKRVILLQEELENPYRPKKISTIGLSENYKPEEKLKEAFDYVEKKAPKQLEVLIAYIKLSERYTAIEKDVAQKDLLASVKNGRQALDALVQKGIFSVQQKLVSRFAHFQQTETDVQLNEYQQKAYEDIKQQWVEKSTILLHGVTSSGKTEIYIQLARETMEKGQQVLFLVPEIALTTQIIRRIQQHFGNKAGVYHSRFNEMERTEVWNNLILGGVKTDEQTIRYQTILGPRSALFLPFNNLGLIIVDEEHETSYKQHDPAPRYHARDAAIWLAAQHSAKVLLGTATPSVESYFNAKSGKYGLVSLTKRHGGVQMPEIFVADIKNETLQKKMKSHLSSFLFQNIQSTLAEKKQVILFRNRRGFAPHMECIQCGHIPNCTQCDVSLVYHKKINKLKCHYCGYTVTPPAKCPSCQATELSLKGFGTEKMEEELPLLFPDYKVKRMDQDTTRAKNAYASIIQDFEDKRIDILVGTQMVTKGLDFENVGLVGILSADSMLSFPDFRAHERAYQMMAQVSGRAGRKNTRGKVIIQAMDPWHTIIRQVIDNNYEEMYSHQSLERRNFLYPPFVRLLQLSFSHSDPEKVNQASSFVASALRKVFPKGRILGPEFPLVARIKAQYIKNIMIKIERNANFTSQKNSVKSIVDEFGNHPEFKQVKLKVNVDPY